MTTDSHDRTDYFSTDAVKSDLKHRALRGGKHVFLAQGFKFLLGLAATVVLARLLTPQDFGLVAMVSSLTGIASMLKSGGLTNATVQAREINHEQATGLFWITVCLSSLMALLIASSSPLIAWFLDDPRTASIALASAVIFFVTGLGMQHTAILRRQMQYGWLSLIEVASLSFGLACAVAAGLMGMGFWALVLSNGASATLQVLALWLVCGWRPGLPRRNINVAQEVSYGMNLTGYKVLNYLSRHADNTIIGIWWGAATLGLYAKAYQLLTLPIRKIQQPVTGVVVPTLARLQDAPSRYRKYFQRALALNLVVSWPIIALLLVTADDLVVVILGKRWSDSVPLFRALGLAALVQPLSASGGWLTQSLGRSDRLLRWGVFSSIVVLGGFLMSARYGTLWMALTYSVLNLLLFLPWLIYSSLGSPVRAKDIFAVASPPAMATLVSSVASLLVGHSAVAEVMHPIGRFAVTAGLFAGLYLIVISVFFVRLKRDFIESAVVMFSPR